MNEAADVSTEISDLLPLGVRQSPEKYPLFIYQIRNKNIQSSSEVRRHMTNTYSGKNGLTNSFKAETYIVSSKPKRIVV